MKKWLPGLLLLLLLLSLLLWKGDELVGHREPGRDDKRTADSRDLSPAGATSVRAAHPTKVSEREAVAVRATHGPQQLKDFFLPPVEIDGLTLAAALQKLKATYEEACRETGEVPLSLVFDIPAGQDGSLRLKLGPRNLDASVRMLASLAGLKVKRDGSMYRFQEPERLAQATRQTMKVPPDLVSRLRDIAGSASEDLRGIFASMGCDLDPATTLMFNPGSMTLEIDTFSSADLARITGLTHTTLNETLQQQKFETKMMEVPAGVDWTAPDLAGQYSDEQIQVMMREIARIKGLDLLTLPSITARHGEVATIEMINELIAPTDDSGKNFEKHTLGHVIKLGGDFLGFGQKTNINYTDTQGGLDPATGKAQIEVKADIKETSFIGDGSTKLYVQTRPDGSRRVMVTTVTRIDATGRPVSESH